MGSVYKHMFTFRLHCGFSPESYLLAFAVSYCILRNCEVSRPGFEPGTPCLKGRCSNRLS